ncbi:MAG: MmgE/PrpD family protein [Gemmobacter sp.]|jgi:2-methylcitrate dehydratase PrpD|nr:MmgE/PrpD family protein [Gemmobacter sp.]
MEATLLQHLAEFACHEHRPNFRAEARRFARHCLLDFAGVAIAGANEPVVNALRNFCLAQGGAAEASVLGHSARLPVRSAALIAGAAGHALDFDDNNMAMQGHPSAPLLGALLPLAEHLGAGGSDLIDALIVGYEVECRIGAGFGFEHYNAGFHATATLGTFGAAAACARLLKLSPGQTADALSIAASQASGLKAMFGTMCKPGQVGMAAEKGVFAALLAKYGLHGSADAIDGTSGFARTHSKAFSSDLARIEVSRQLEIEHTIFKYHASCFDTHAVIEAIRVLMREQALTAPDIRNIDIFAYEEIDTVCNIARPDTGLGLKFSLRGVAALAVLGIPTESIATFSDEMARDARVVDLRERTAVHLRKGYPQSYAEVTLTLHDGRTFERRHDSAVVGGDPDDQERRLKRKFATLLRPILGNDHTDGLACVILDMDAHGVADLVSLMQTPSLREVAR